MKIFFRYLLWELVQPFLFCIIACSSLWIVVDLYGNLSDFYENHTPLNLIITYFLAQLPRLMVDVLPMAMMFASLYTLLSLTKRNELIALQAGGLSSFQLFTPFVTLALVVWGILFYVVAWPANKAEARRAEIMTEVKNHKFDHNVYRGMIYVDQKRNRVWYIQKLNVTTGQAEGLELLQRDSQNHDVEKYFGEFGEYNGQFWRLRKARHFLFNSAGDVIQQESLTAIDLDEYTMSPMDLLFTQSKPTELTLTELSRYLRTARGQLDVRLAPYRTQYEYLYAYPASVLVLLGFALALGTKQGRGGPAGGVFNAIFILLGYIILIKFFSALGDGNRIPPIVAAWGCHVLFGTVALIMMGARFGWFWQWQRHWRLATTAHATVENPMEDVRARDLRLKGLRILLDKITKENTPTNPPPTE